MQVPVHHAGKPVGGDLRAGVLTAPVLFALRTRPELKRLIVPRARKPHATPLDIQRAIQLVIQVLLSLTELLPAPASSIFSTQFGFLFGLRILPTSLVHEIYSSAASHFKSSKNAY